MRKSRARAAAPALDRPLLTIREAADLLRVSERTVRRHVADGSLRTIRIGRSIRIAHEAIVSFVRGEM